MPDQPVACGVERARDGFGMAFERRFAPAGDAVVGLDPHEKPARRDEEPFDICDRTHAVVVSLVKEGVRAGRTKAGRPRRPVCRSRSKMTAASRIPPRTTYW